MRVFRRPMFRRGGTTNQGIMTGLVDRRRYDTGAFGRTAKEYATDIQSIMGAPDINQLLIQGGLGIAGGQGTGQGALADVASAFKGPTDKYFQQAMAKKMTAKKLGVEMAMKERLAKQKAMAGAGFLKKEPDQRTRDKYILDALEKRSKLPYHVNPSIEILKPKAAGEFYVDIQRGLERQGLDIPTDWIPYDKNKQEFRYDQMLPGTYYFDPRHSGYLMLRIPPDKDTPKEKTGIFKVDYRTWEKKKISDLAKN